MAATDLGTRIRRARERKRWNQKQLADAIGVGVRSVGRWERGESVPRNAIGALEQVLGENFGTDAPDPHEAEIRDLAARTGFTPAEADEWVARYRRRNPPGRQLAS